MSDQLTSNLKFPEAAAVNCGNFQWHNFSFGLELFRRQSAFSLHLFIKGKDESAGYFYRSDDTEEVNQEVNQ